jgi:hypothetical protein
MLIAGRLESLFRAEHMGVVALSRGGYMPAKLRGTGWHLWLSAAIPLRLDLLKSLNLFRLW